MKKLFPLLLCLTLVGSCWWDARQSQNDSSGTNSDIQGENSSPATTSTDMNIAALKGQSHNGDGEVYG